MIQQSRKHSNVNRLARQRIFRSRRGAAAVEAALLSSFVLAIVVSAIDVGQYANTKQIVSNAAREGVRIASRDQTLTVADVNASVRTYIQTMYSGSDSTTIANAIQTTVYGKSGQVISSGAMSQIASGDSFSVKVRFDFTAVRWLPLVDYWNFHYAQVTSFGRRD